MEQSDEAEIEPKEDGELKSHYEGSHSPFGLVWQIASATGWSIDYILHGVNYQTLLLMLADAPRYVTTRAGKSEKTDKPGNQKSVLGFFQSKLKDNGIDE